MSTTLPNYACSSLPQPSPPTLGWTGPSLGVLWAPSLCPSADPEVYVHNQGFVCRCKIPITEAPSSKSQKPEPPAACRREMWWYMRSGRQNGTSQPNDTSHADDFHISSKKGKSYTFLSSELFLKAVISFLKLRVSLKLGCPVSESTQLGTRKRRKTCCLHTLWWVPDSEGPSPAHHSPSPWVLGVEKYLR